MKDEVINDETGIQWLKYFGSETQEPAGPCIEYLAPTYDGFIANEYLYGSLWIGKPGAFNRLTLEGHFVNVDGDEKRWAAIDSDGKRIVVGTPNGVETKKIRWESIATAIAVADDKLWVALEDNIFSISHTGEFLDNLPIAGAVALAYDKKLKRLAIACPEKHQVILYDSLAQHFYEIDKVRGRQFSFPRGVEFAEDGMLWITDTENRRIVREDGKTVDLRKRAGFPVGIAAYKQQLWVTFPFERLVLNLKEAGLPGESNRPYFYPYAVAFFKDDLWVSYPASGAIRSYRNETLLSGLADPIAMTAWIDSIAIAERDNSRIVCISRDGSISYISLPHCSQPRALAVSTDGALWIATQTPKSLWLYRDNCIEYVCQLHVKGVPRAMAWVKDALALATTEEKAILWVDPCEGTVKSKNSLPEAPISLASYGDSLFAGLDRLGCIVKIVEGNTVLVADNLVTPRGLVVDDKSIVVAESLAHRIRWGNCRYDKYVME